MSENQPKPVAELSFEEALRQLEAIVTDLERGEVPLAKSVEIYERGAALKEHCNSLLKQAEERVEKIRLGESGAAEGVEPLDVD